MTPEEVKHAVTDLLSHVAGRRTSIRESVLNILLSEPTALNHQSIEEIAEQRGLSLDKVTLYRTLDWLVEQGVAHRIASVNRSWYFNALPQSGTKPHAHFHCKQCFRIYCMEDIHPASQANLPNDYQLEEADLCLQGSCLHCS